jgi:hypothetical protein
MEALKWCILNILALDTHFVLNSVINDGNIAIIRTISTGVPHWIIPVSYVDNIYINDPWLGRIQYSIEELKVIWGIRDYQFLK